MTRHVFTIEASDSVYQACVLYKKYKIGSLVVIDKEICVGILTERDIIERTICEQKNPETAKVRDIMSSPIHTIHRLDTVEKAIELMKTFDIKKIPVVSKKGIVGIVTMTDVCKARPELSQRFKDSWMKPCWAD